MVLQKLGEADEWLAKNKTIAEICTRSGVIEWMYYGWRNEYGGVNGLGYVTQGVGREGCSPKEGCC